MSGAPPDATPLDETPLDEMVDGAGGIRPHWRGLLGGLMSLPDGALVERARLLDRLSTEEEATGAPPPRLDPVPFVLSGEEFGALAEGLAQRARLLEAVLADLYDGDALLRDGAIPPELVFANPGFLRPARGAGVRPFLQSLAADLIRAPDGRWTVVADGVGDVEGMARALSHRGRLARALPEAVRAVGVRPLRPFVDAWRDALQRAAGEGGVALLTPGVLHPAWAEHVRLARDLSCALAEPGDLAVRGGAVFLKTLRGLRPLRVLLRRVPGRALDPLEDGGDPGRGVAGLLDAWRRGAVLLLNHPGAELVEAPALGAFLPRLSERLLGEPLRLPCAGVTWPAAAGSRHAADPRAEPPDEARLRAEVAVPAASLAPALGGGRLEPRAVSLRLFLVRDGAAWRTMPGGVARLADATAKDVWVTAEEGGEVRGTAALTLPAMAIRRTAGDLPSRVADNLFWLGRYVERLDDAARLMRATIARLERAPVLPRDIAELRPLSRCLVVAKLIPEEAGGGEAALRHALSGAADAEGQLMRLTARVERLVEASRDRLTGDMLAAFTGPLREARAALRITRGLPGLSAALGLLVRYASGVAGVAAENMVRGGAHAFLDLGRRMERAASVAGMLGQVLAEPPARVESGLALALELCDSVITYRNRYLHVLQPGPALDLVIADPANPRGLAFQLAAAAALLAQVEGEGDAALAGEAASLRSDAETMAAEVVRASGLPDGGAAAAAALSPRLLAMEEAVSGLSDGVARRYFTLLAAPRRLGVDTAEPVRGAA